MRPIQNEALIQQLRWRYATKKFDPARKISDEDWETLEEALVLTPSSFGLQPWKFFVVSNPVLREKLLPVSWGQRQVIDASHLVVFAIRKNLGTEDLDHYLRRMAEVRGIGVASLDPFRKIVAGFLSRDPSEFNVNEWATRQVYIALGNFMTSAALIGIDTCPMEGLEPAQYDQVLGLAGLGYATVVACPAGYRASDDKYAVTPKVRFPASEMIQRIG